MENIKLFCFILLNIVCGCSSVGSSAENDLKQDSSLIDQIIMDLLPKKVGFDGSLHTRWFDKNFSASAELRGKRSPVSDVQKSNPLYVKAGLTADTNLAEKVKGLEQELGVSDVLKNLKYNVQFDDSLPNTHIRLTNFNSSWRRRKIDDKNMNSTKSDTSQTPNQRTLINTSDPKSNVTKAESSNTKSLTPNQPSNDINSGGDAPRSPCSRKSCGKSKNLSVEKSTSSSGKATTPVINALAGKQLNSIPSGLQTQQRILKADGITVDISSIEKNASHSDVSTMSIPTLGTTLPTSKMPEMSETTKSPTTTGSSVKLIPNVTTNNVPTTHSTTEMTTVKASTDMPSTSKSTTTPVTPKIPAVTTRQMASAKSSNAPSLKPKESSAISAYPLISLVLIVPVILSIV